MVHLYGADYLVERPQYCRQYQTRLDIHGLGITAIEILCAVALGAREAGARTSTDDSDFHWGHLLDVWDKYQKTVGMWWEMIYSVFSVGGDFRPVHAWLCQEAVADQVISLLADIRQALKQCAASPCAGEDQVLTSGVLNVLADLIDESSTLELSEASGRLDEVRNKTLACGTAAIAGPDSEQPAMAMTSPSIGELEGAAAPITDGCAVFQDQTDTSHRHVDPKALAAAAAEESRQVRGQLDNLMPLPTLPLVAPQLGGPGSDGSTEREVEVVELWEVKNQLQSDLEKLELLKLRLHEYVRQITNETGLAAANAIAIPTATVAPG
jgi:hypothetical protein